MKQPKFKVGEVVLYQNGTKFELGIVKSIVTLSSEQEGSIPYGYRVWYHMGDTTALTHESDLHKIINDYAFTVLRRKADSSSIDDTPARQWAAKILEDSSLKGDAYYKEEDRITAILNGDA